MNGSRKRSTACDNKQAYFIIEVAQRWVLVSSCGGGGGQHAVQAINNLAASLKVRRILRDEKGLGRPREFLAKRDFRQWSKKTEAFFAAGVIKESEMM